MMAAHPIQWILGCILILSSFGVILLEKPVHASLSFLLTILTLAALYLQLSADFIGVLQILVYGGAILVIFVFVIVLFQDAYVQIQKFKPLSSSLLLFLGASSLVISFGFLGKKLYEMNAEEASIPEGFGTVESLGKILYIDFFFPFEAVTLLFLLAAIGALYIGRK